MINAAATSTNSAEVTRVLVDAFSVAIQNITEPLIFVIDGPSELIYGEDQTTALLHGMLDFISDSNIKIMVFSRPLVLSSLFSPRRFGIEPTHVQDDVRRIVASKYTVLPSHERADLVQNIQKKAQGNFLWLMFVFQRWDSTKEIAPRDWRALPGALETACKQLVSAVEFSVEAVPLLLSICAVSQRPLSIEEVEILISLDLGNRRWLRKQIHVQELVRGNCEAILIIRGGLVQFRYSFLKHHLVAVAQERMMSTIEARSDLTNRLLLYLRLILTDTSELTLNPIASHAIDKLINTHQLLNHALRYWTVHFRRSNMLNDPDSSASNNTCRAVFPNSVYSSLLRVPTGIHSQLMILCKWLRWQRD